MNQQPNKYVLVTPAKPPEKFTPEWALYHFLKDFTPEDMELAIRKNFPWDLSAYIDVVIDMAIKELLKMMEKWRPDLHKVLNTKEGQRYLKCKMKEALTQT
jgi:hypothetical protein